MTDTNLYFGNPLSSFEMGLQLDWRARYATELMKAHAGMSPRDALDMATEFLDLCAARGYSKPLPETDELNAPLRKHIRRNMRAQVYQQVVGQEIMKEEQPSVQPVRGLGPLS
jgi:hypothetical protein